MPLGLGPSFNSHYHGGFEGQKPREISLHRVADARMKELSSLPHQGLPEAPLGKLPGVLWELLGGLEAPVSLPEDMCSE